MFIYLFFNFLNNLFSAYERKINQSKVKLDIVSSYFAELKSRKERMKQSKLKKFEIASNYQNKFTVDHIFKRLLSSTFHGQDERTRINYFFAKGKDHK